MGVPVYRVVLVATLLLSLVVSWCSGEIIVEEVTDKSFEAAFQGKCSHGSACEQLCYELHDGMYECDCRAGFELNKDGYSCFEKNGTDSNHQDGTMEEGEDILYQKDASFSAELAVALAYSNTTSETSNEPSNINQDITTQSPNLEQKMPNDIADFSGSSLPKSTLSLLSATPESPCLRDCGPAGSCAVDDAAMGTQFCECPLGRGGAYCDKDVEIRSPRFTGRSWLAFPALRAAYKHVQVNLELRPEAYDGIFLLTGERDDMAGDFMALLLHQGFVEFRFDCGSGVGVVRSEETVLLNQWNHITLYRHRWDAWLQLNDGKHIQGRSKGLFSRITFREPLFIGGAGNTTGLSEKLPVVGGLKGCVRHLEVNDQTYRFALEPQGDASKGFGIQECTADRCSRVPCQHGGKCLTSQESAVCLCPLGFSGDLCETRVDLQVPAFNGSSYLRYRGLADSALTWLDIEITLKPSAANGMLLYNGHRTDGSGDFMALYMKDKHVEFAFDLGTGTGLVRSADPLTLGEWHQVKISRTGRLAIMQVDQQKATEILSPGAFTQLSLPQNLYLGGVPNFSTVSSKITIRTSFVGCVQKVVINGNNLSILAEALGGVNVDNCPHPCVARPCGEDGSCIPDLDYFTCECKPGYRDQLCSQKTPTQMTTIEMPIPSFTGKDSYLHFSDSKTIKRLKSNPLDVNMRFKVSSADGLLLWFGMPEGGVGKDFLAIGVERGSLVLRYNLGYEEMVIVYNVSRVNDNLWHRIKAIRNSTGGLLVVDDGPAITTQSIAPLQPHNGERGLYVGGMPQTDIATGHRYNSGIMGCVADLVLNADYRIQLITMSAVGRNVGHCEP